MAAPVALSGPEAELYCNRILEEVGKVIAKNPAWSEEQIEKCNSYICEEFTRLFFDGIDIVPGPSAGTEAATVDADFMESLCDIPRKTKQLLKELTRRRKAYPAACVQLLEQRQQCEYELLVKDRLLPAGAAPKPGQVVPDSVRRSPRKHVHEQQHRQQLEDGSLIRMLGDAARGALQASEALDATARKLSNNAAAREMMEAMGSHAAASDSYVEAAATSHVDGSSSERRLLRRSTLQSRVGMYKKRS